MDTKPLISCICVSHNDLLLLKRSIECFLKQTYAHKELIIAHTPEKQETSDFVNSLGESSIRCIEVQKSISLGEKRNKAIEFSNGLYFCNWDDDDWFGENRLEQQMERIQKTNLPCSVLSSVFLYDAQEEIAYLSGRRKAWEPTILCEKGVLNDTELRYANVDQGEDSVLLYHLLERKLVDAAFLPNLYVYVYHGKNTTKRKHWEDNIFKHATRLEFDKSEIIKNIVQGNLDYKEACRKLKNLIV